MNERKLFLDGDENLKASRNTQKKHSESKTIRSARNRLFSIRYDVIHFCRPMITENPILCNLPIVANERCGLWYSYPLMTNNSASCCFKSTDGHVGTWNFSLKRLNLNVVRILCTHKACIILDASTSKVIPDSFSRTIPIWAAVLNRIATRFRKDYDMPTCRYDNWNVDKLLFTPNNIVSASEHELILSLIEERVDALYNTCAIVDPVWLACNLLKPIRPYWISPQSTNAEEIFYNDMWSEYYSIICISCSDYSKSKQKITVDVESIEPFFYLCGAADDHESWARHLTAQLFWDNIREIQDSHALCDDAFNGIIDSIVERQSVDCNSIEVNIDGFAYSDCSHHHISNLIIYVGTRRSGRPPECWRQFDAILNVTDSEYEGICDSISDLGKNCFYLQLPVREGKRDRTELERWMAVGIVFVVTHARKHCKVLVHCAQGADRSVALVMAVVAIFCDMKYPLQWNSTFWQFPVASFLDDDDNRSQAHSSGLAFETIRDMQGRVGRDRLLTLLYPDTFDRSFNVTKATIRIALLLIQQDREKANPSRSTVQKLHRFFMSS